MNASIELQLKKRVALGRRPLAECARGYYRESKAYGAARLDTQREAMRAGPICCLAVLHQNVATSTSIMILIGKAKCSVSPIRGSVFHSLCKGEGRGRDSRSRMLTPRRFRFLDFD